MKKKFTLRPFLYFIFYCCPVSSVFSQQVQQLHAHTDKEMYLPGETIWFKAYIFENGQPSKTSTNLYAGLYDGKGKLLQEKRYPIFTGTANGDFEIPDSLLSQFVQLRLFTKAMHERDSNQAYLKAITVYQKQKDATTIVSFANIDVQAFVEGGTLVQGLSNYIGFKAVFEDGSKAALNNAVLTDGKDKFIDTVYFNSDGLGKTQLMPEAGNKYFISWIDKNGQQKKKELPSATASGAVLHTELEGRNLHYSIQKNNNIPRFDKLQLIIRSGEETIYSSIIDLKKQQFISKLPVDSLSAGISEIVLSDAEGNVLQSKQLYIRSKNGLPSIKFLERSNLPKGKNVVEITLPDTVMSNLSLSVADAVFYPGEIFDSFEDEVLLNKNSSILYNAAGNGKETDLVLLTNQVAKASGKYTPDNYLALQASFNNSNAYPENAMLTLVATDKIMGKQVFTLNPATGNGFLKDGLIVYDSAKLNYHLNKKELSKFVKIKEVPGYKQPAHIKEFIPVKQQYASVVRSSADTELVENYWSEVKGKFNREKTMRVITVKAKRRDPGMARIVELDEKYATNVFKGLARGFQFNLLDDPMVQAHSDIFSYIGYKVPGVKIDYKGMFRELVDIRSNEPLKLYINESEADYDMLANISVTQIAYVKVIPGLVITGVFRSVSGAIYVYLTKGDEPNINYVSNMQTSFIKGYDLPQEFSVPDYSDKEATFSKDYRSTLYWNPYLEANSNSRKITIEYYNNDIDKKQMLVLKGFSEEGALVELRRLIE